LNTTFTIEHHDVPLGEFLTLVEHVEGEVTDDDMFTNVWFTVKTGDVRIMWWLNQDDADHWRLIKNNKGGEEE